VSRGHIGPSGPSQVPLLAALCHPLPDVSCISPLLGFATGFEPEGDLRPSRKQIVGAQRRGRGKILKHAFKSSRRAINSLLLRVLTGGLCRDPTAALTLVPRGCPSPPLGSRWSNMRSRPKNNSPAKQKHLAGLRLRWSTRPARCFRGRRWRGATQTARLCRELVAIQGISLRSARAGPLPMSGSLRNLASSFWLRRNR
jgi:hypothetical protein